MQYNFRERFVFGAVRNTATSFFTFEKKTAEFLSTDSRDDEDRNVFREDDGELALPEIFVCFTS